MSPKDNEVCPKEKIAFPTKEFSGYNDRSKQSTNKTLRQKYGTII